MRFLRLLFQILKKLEETCGTHASRRTLTFTLVLPPLSMHLELLHLMHHCDKYNTGSGYGLLLA